MKRFLALTLALFLSTALAACGGKAKPNNPTGGEAPSAGSTAQGEEKETVVAQKRSAVTAKLNNYKITMKANWVGSEMTVTEMHWATGHVTQITEDALTYVDMAHKKTYTLNTKDKTGVVMPETNGADELFQGLIGTFLFNHESYTQLHRAGAETVAGRRCTTYIAKGDERVLGQFSYKVWIDNEYGVTLRMESVAKDHVNKATYESSFTTTEFRVGNAKLEDMVRLSDYTLQDLTALG
jgi:predicted small lipoprotein YifL